MFLGPTLSYTVVVVARNITAGSKISCHILALSLSLSLSLSLYPSVSLLTTACVSPTPSVTPSFVSYIQLQDYAPVMFSLATNCN